MGKSAHKSQMLTNTKEIYGGFHYSSEDGFFKAPAGCVIRNAPQSPNFRLENLQKPHILNSRRLPGLTAASRSWTLHCFYPLCLFFMTHECSSILQRLGGHLLGCFHAGTHILCSDLLEIVLRAHWSKERLVRIFLNLDPSCPIYKGQPTDYKHILGLSQTQHILGQHI